MFVISEEYTSVVDSFLVCSSHVLRTNKEILTLSLMEWTLYLS